MANRSSTQSQDRPLALAGKSLFSLTPGIEINEQLEGMLDRIETSHAMAMAVLAEDFDTLCLDIKQGYYHGLVRQLSELKELHDQIHAYFLIMQQEFVKKK